MFDLFTCCKSLDVATFLYTHLFYPSPPNHRNSPAPLAPTGSPSRAPSVSPSSVSSAAPSLLPSSAPTSLSQIAESCKAENKSFVGESCVFSADCCGTQSGCACVGEGVCAIISDPDKVGVCLFRPSDSPSEAPSLLPSDLPSERPSLSPSGAPSTDPSDLPSERPSLSPSNPPSETPSLSQMPSMVPSDEPSLSPSDAPSDQPSLQPSSSPSDVPSSSPSTAPSSEPSMAPSTTCVPALMDAEKLAKVVPRNDNSDCAGTLDGQPRDGVGCGGDGCCANQVQPDSAVDAVVVEPTCCPAGTLMCPSGSQVECCIGILLAIGCSSQGGCPQI